MVYVKNSNDGYIKVSSGACQLQCYSKFVNRLGVIHSDAAPAADADPEFIFGGITPEVTLGTADCYVKVLSITPVEFSATEI